MILLLHIAIALGSILEVTSAYVRPSITKLRASYVLAAATLASGTYLVVSTHSPLASSCVTGIFYLTVVAAGIVAATRKLAVVKQTSESQSR